MAASTRMNKIHALMTTMMSMINTRESEVPNAASTALRTKVVLQASDYRFRIETTLTGFLEGKEVGLTNSLFSAFCCEFYMLLVLE